MRKPEKWILRSASGDLTAADTGNEVEVRSQVATVFLNVSKLTLPDADDEVDFYVQTTYDGGTTWSDLENVHFAQADNGTTPKKILAFGLRDVLAADTAAAHTDAALADGTKLKLPLGTEIRIKTKVAGATPPTYAYSADVVFI